MLKLCPESLSRIFLMTEKIVPFFEIVFGLAPVLPITHKPFRHVGNSEQIGGNPGKPFRPLEKNLGFFSHT